VTRRVRLIKVNIVTVLLGHANMYAGCNEVILCWPWSSNSSSPVLNRGSDPQKDLITHIDFNPAPFLSMPGFGRRIVLFKPKQVFYTQGSPADSVFYIKAGRAKLTVVSKEGKEATVTLLAPGDFVGEESLVGANEIRAATACASTPCVTMRIDRQEMLRALRNESNFSDLFLSFMLTRAMRTQADLIDHLFNSSERRLARTLLLMADFDKPGMPEQMIPKITQETLAEMIGTTRSRVSYFMNRFRKLGYIEYKGRIHVNKSLLDALLRDRLPENSSKPRLLDPPPSAARIVRRNKLL
jgi:CRP/FNR family cyclic AMP-dependent transcriptional regulator